MGGLFSGGFFFGWGVGGAYGIKESLNADHTKMKLTLTPSLVFQDKPSLFASTDAVMVEPLLPPQPTNIHPTLGTRLSVRNVYSVSTGLTV